MLGALRVLCRARRLCAAASSSGALPRHTLINMPALSPTMTAGHVGAWQRAEGEAVAAGDVLVDIETDKATVGLEAQEDGFLARILLQEGARDVAVGTPLAVLAFKKDGLAAFKNYTPPKAKSDNSHSAPDSSNDQKADAEPKDTQQSADHKLDQDKDRENITKENGSTHSPAPTKPMFSSQNAPKNEELADPAAEDQAHTTNDAIAKTVLQPAQPGGRVAASPHARDLAQKLGVHIASLSPGSGPGGRIVSADVQKAASADSKSLNLDGQTKTRAMPRPEKAGATESTPFTDIPLTNMRRTIAQRLLESKQTIPHFSVAMDVAVDRLVALRRRYNDSLKDGSRLSVNDFVVKAAAHALVAVPSVNASWHAGTHIRQHASAHVSVAVALPDGAGLVTPVVRSAEAKGVAAIGAEIRELAARARAGRLAPADMAGGTFTVSNLGMYGVASFSAIINPPQAAILAVGGVHRRLVPGPEDAPVASDTMTLTLSCDHRVVDGATAAHFLQTLRRYLEDPSLLIL